MLSKVLISCALFMVAQAGYASSGYGSGAQIGGYLARGRPAATVQILPGRNYGGYGQASYGGIGYGAGGYGGIGYGQGGRLSAPLIAAARAQPSAGGLANIALALPSAGLPNPDTIGVRQHAITTYTAPGVVYSSGNALGGGVSSSDAAVAASLVRSGGSGYGPSQAIIGAGSLGGAGLIGGAGSYGSAY